MSRHWLEKMPWNIHFYLDWIDGSGRSYEPDFVDRQLKKPTVKAVLTSSEWIRSARSGDIFGPVEAMSGSDRFRVASARLEESISHRDCNGLGFCPYRSRAVSIGTIEVRSIQDDFDEYWLPVTESYYEVWLKRILDDAINAPFSTVKR